ncbi:MAG: PorT family protein [Flavobacteriaceae bacterium]|nr:PorT family protein [Flavobacteriaceae bacterium]
MKNSIYILILICCSYTYSQNTDLYKDNKYREDQVYISALYNTIVNKSGDINITGLSPTISIGLIRDIPLNKNRNFGLSIGAGYSYESYNSNIGMLEFYPKDVKYVTILTEETTKSQFALNSIEFPIFIRWRTSTALTYDFWRVYMGLVSKYVFYNSYTYKGENGDFKQSNLSVLNKWTYGIQLDLGYGAINASIYYGLNSFTKKAPLNSDLNPISHNILKIGLTFYIL